MSQRTLAVLINGEWMGDLTDQNNLWGFQYAASWLSRRHPYPLSPSLPLGPEPLLDGATVRPVQWFFDNLLPEETLRTVIGREEGVPAEDAFGLLERLGAESAGALVLQPHGAEDAVQGTQELSHEVLSARIRKLPVASLHRQAPKRMSLAGAQHKMVVCFDPATGGLAEPLKGSASTHILKPDSTAVGYPRSVVNETFTMRLAAMLGVRVPSVWRLYVPEPVYIIERFDRIRGADGRPLRVHAVDGSQALNESGHNKYASATFPALLRLVGLCLNRAVARLEIFRWILFNTLVGNSDCHLKNISFLIDSEGMRVAPFYDLLCTAVYHTPALADEPSTRVWPAETLAMPVAGAANFCEVTQEKLVATGMELGLGKGTAVRETARMIARLPDAADGLIERMTAEYGAMPILAQIPPETRAAELHLLRAIRHVVIADMLRFVR